MLYVESTCKSLLGSNPFSKNVKSDTFERAKNCVTSENFLIFMENTFHDFQKNFKSDTFENYKTFVASDVQSHTYFFALFIFAISIFTLCKVR